MNGPLDLLSQAARLARAKGHTDAEIVAAVDPHAGDGPSREDLAEVIRLMARDGHTEHCAKGIAYSGQECGCRRPRAPEYHTMNPPPGGYKMDAQARLWSELKMLSSAAQDYLAGMGKDSDWEESDWTEWRSSMTRLMLMTQNSAQTLERTKSKTPLPVYIAENDEAVLMLTSASRGHVVPVPVRLIVGGVEGVGPMYTDSPSPARVSTKGVIYIVSETVEDIRATLAMLAESDGGER